MEQIMQIKLSDKFYLFKNLITLSNKSFINDIDQQIDSGNLCLEVTAVYYLKNNLSCFGTIIEDSVIIPGEENSLLIFDPKIKHSIVNTPNNIYKNIGPRYSIVFDFISDRK